MQPKKILTVFGTRPEAIEMAPLVKLLGEKDWDSRVCITGQHRKMLDQVFNLLDIIADYDLNIMKPEQDIHDVTTGVLRRDPTADSGEFVSSVLRRITGVSNASSVCSVVVCGNP